MARKQTPAEPRGVALYQLKITLKRCHPAIWRRVVVRADITLARLHEVIQAVMGWGNYHLHQFSSGGGFARTYYGVPDPEFGSEMLDERRFRLGGVAPLVKRKIIYEYDFGDSWEHEVLVEKILPADAAFKHPVCLAGANACPPEDCGGFMGYANLLEALTNPKHAEHDDMKGWIGGNWDPTRFDLDAANARLRRL